MLSDLASFTSFGRLFQSAGPLKSYGCLTYFSLDDLLTVGATLFSVSLQVQNNGARNFPDGGHCQSVLRRQWVLLLPPSKTGWN